MFRRILLRAALGALVAATIGAAAVTHAGAYGPANWQTTFAGTGPGFGFWGWCDFAGATAWDSTGLPVVGTSGDCQFAEYVHAPGFSGTCEISMDLTAEGGQPAWQVKQSSITGGPDFFASGTFVTHPSSQTSFCENLPGSPPSSPFSNFDLVLPAHPGHINASGFFGTTELQIQETVIR